MASLHSSRTPTKTEVFLECLQRCCLAALIVNLDCPPDRTKSYLGVVRLAPECARQGSLGEDDMRKERQSLNVVTLSTRLGSQMK